MTSAEPTASPFLLFRARAQLCALPVEHVRETMRPMPLTPFPGAPAFVLGVARIRGAAVPVIDLGALLEALEPPQPTRFLSLRREGSPVALAVETVVGLRKLGPNELSELPPLMAAADQEAVSAIGALDAELVLSLQATRIVPESLWALLNAGSVL